MFRVLVYTLDESLPIEGLFTSESNARAFIKEELKWESTIRVICDELNINEVGDFESLRKG